MTCKGASLLDISELEPLQGNLKTLSEEDYGKLKKSLLRYGITFPLFVYKRNRKIFTMDGHQRDRVLRKMREEGYEIPKVPVDFIDAKNRKEAAEKILLLASQYGKMTNDSLYEFLETESLDFSSLKEVIELPQIDLGAFERGWITDEIEEVPEPQIDRAKELQKKWKTARGQIWEIGKHRLMCGDSREKSEVDHLLGDSSIVLMVTDPPYGVNYSAVVSSRGGQKRGGWLPIENDDLDDDALYDLLYKSFSQRKIPTAIVWYGFRRSPIFWRAITESGWKINQQIIWVKNTLVFGRADYQWKHEAAFYCKTDDTQVDSDRTVTTIWEINKPVASDHPTQKPVELFTIPIKRHTKIGDIIYDCFSGSGTTLVAAEQLGRICYGVEIDPSYCAVALQRMADMDLKPLLLPPQIQAHRRKAKLAASHS